MKAISRVTVTCVVVCTLLTGGAQAASQPVQSFHGAWAPKGNKEAQLFLFPDGRAFLPAPCIGSHGRWSVNRDGNGITMDLTDADGTTMHYELLLTSSGQLKVKKPNDIDWVFRKTRQALPDL